MKRIWVWTKEKRIYYYDVKFHVLPQKIIEKIPVDPDDLQNKVTDSKDAEIEKEAEAEIISDDKVEEPKAEKKSKSPEPKSTASESPIPEAISQPVADEISDDSQKVDDVEGGRGDSELTENVDIDPTEKSETQNNDAVLTDTIGAEIEDMDSEVQAEAVKETEKLQPATDNIEIEKSEDEVEKHEIISEGLLEIEITEV